MLRLALLLFVLLCALAGVSVLTGMRAHTWERFEFTEPHMGTTFRILLYAPDEATARDAAGAAFARIGELDAMLSDYDPESEVSRLSRASDDGPTGWIDVSPDLQRVLARAQVIARASDGRFDVTVGPAVRLWRRARRQGALPSSERIDEALAAMGHEKLEVDGSRVRLLARGMRLDLGGIAKGYAVEEARRVLQQEGLASVLIDGGGDLAIGAAPPGTNGWRVELRAERGKRERALPRRLEHSCVATSGDSEQFVEIDSVRYSHLVSPVTARAVTGRREVTIVARGGMEADALASVMSVAPARAEGAPNLLLTWLEAGGSPQEQPWGFIREEDAEGVRLISLP